MAMNNSPSVLIRNFSFILLCFSCISAKSQVNEVDKYINCKMQYEQVSKYAKSLEDFRGDILPIANVKNQYMSSLRFRALNGNADERRDASPKYYGDEDYEIFNLNLIIGFALRDLKEFAEKRNWADDRLIILKMVHGGGEFNYYSNNNPFSFISK